MQISSQTSSGCKRPLPPPLSYDAVLAQFDTVITWKTIDDEGDILLGNDFKRQKMSHNHSMSREEDLSTTGSALNTLHDHNVHDCYDEVSKPQLLNHRAQILPPSISKPFTEAIEEETADRSPNLLDHWCQPHSEPRNEANRPWQLPSAADQEEADMLLRLTTGRYTSTQTQGGGDGREEEDINAERAKEEEEARGRERSRAMREKALSSRADTSQRPHEDATAIHQTAVVPHVETHAKGAAVGETTSGNYQEIHAANSMDKAHTDVVDTSETESMNLYLDICQSHATNGSAVEQQLQSGNKKLNTNPFSRSEAEKYCTQSRHLNISSTEDRINSQARPSFEGVERLRQLTQYQQQRLPSRQEAVILDSQPSHWNQNKFDHANAASQRHRALSTANPHHSMTGTMQGTIIGAQSDDQVCKKVDSTILRVKEAEKDSLISTSLTPFQQLELTDKLREKSPLPYSGSSGRVSVEQQPSEKANAEFVAYPGQEGLRAILTLPNTFSNMNHECQNAILHHEALKERKRDLEAIKVVFEHLASIGAVKVYDRKEREWMNEAKQFSMKVIDEKLHGKKVRDRMKQIGDSLRRRLLRLPKPDPAQMQDLMKTLLHHRFDLLRKELVVIDQETNVAGLIRHEVLQKRWAVSKATLRGQYRKRNSQAATIFAPGGSQRESMQRKERQIVHDGLSLTERKRQAQYESHDRKLMALKERLGMFDADTAEDERPDSDLHTSTEVQLDNDEMSEEDEGENHYTGAGVQNLVAMTQRPDDTLMEENISRHAQRSINHEQETQLPDMSLASDNVVKSTTDYISHESVALHFRYYEDNVQNQDFDDISEAEDFDQEDNECDRFCHRYVVTATYQGFGDFEEGVDYTLNAFLKVENANARVDEHVKTLVDSYRCTEEYRQDPTIEHRGSDTRDGLRDWTVIFGQDSIAMCHVRVMQEQYQVNAEAYENAKIRQTCDGKPVYWVLWRKVLRPLTADRIDWEKDITRGKPELTTETQEWDNTLQPSTNDVQCCDEALKSTTHEVGAIQDVVREEDETFDDLLDELFGSDSPLMSAQDAKPFSFLHHFLVMLPVLQDPNTSKWNHEASTTDREPPIFLPPTPPATDPTSPESQQNEVLTSLSAAATTTSTTMTTTTPSTHPSNQLTHEIHYNDIQQFTTIALANRHAKTTYMAWYAFHLSGPSNEAFLRTEEAQMEQDLLNHGDMSTWSREEDFEVIVHGTMKAIESYKVWVEKKVVKGPAN